MSKSAESDLSRINLLDDAAAIRNKVKRAKTDAFEGLEFDNAERPEANNLLTIYSLMTGGSKASAVRRLGTTSWGQELAPQLSRLRLHVLAHGFL